MLVSVCVSVYVYMCVYVGYIAQSLAASITTHSVE